MKRFHNLPHHRCVELVKDASVLRTLHSGLGGLATHQALAITHESSKMAPNSVFSMEDFLGLNQSSSAACSGAEVPISSSVRGYLDVTFRNLLPQSCNRKLNKVPLFLWGIYWILLILPCLMVILYGKQQRHLRYYSAFLAMLYLPFCSEGSFLDCDSSQLRLL